MRNLSFLVLSGLMVACGGNETAPAPAPAPEPAAAPAPAPEPEPEVEANIVTVTDGVAAVALEGNDMMQFNAKTITVPAGSTVKLTLTHTGKQPKAVMGHNFVLLAKGTDYDAFTKAAIAAKDSDHIPGDMKSSILAHTKLIGGGETDTIEFAAPEKGEYQFLCSFPGHNALMKGTLIVE